MVNSHICNIRLSFFFNDTATTEIYTLSLHDALPISVPPPPAGRSPAPSARPRPAPRGCRSEEHTSELQSLTNLVCRLLLEKKKREQFYHNRLTTLDESYGIRSDVNYSHTIALQRYLC